MHPTTESILDYNKGRDPERLRLKLQSLRRDPFSFFRGTAALFYRTLIVPKSMSDTGNCYDNAPMESFWHSLRVEETHGQDFATRPEEKHCVFGNIEGRYNTTWMHSSLCYQSPAPFERKCNAELIETATTTYPQLCATKAKAFGRIKKRVARRFCRINVKKTIEFCSEMFAVYVGRICPAKA